MSYRATKSYGGPLNAYHQGKEANLKMPPPSNIFFLSVFLVLILLQHDSHGHPQRVLTLKESMRELDRLPSAPSWELTHGAA